MIYEIWKLPGHPSLFSFFRYDELRGENALSYDHYPPLLKLSQKQHGYTFFLTMKFCRYLRKNPLFLNSDTLTTLIHRERRKLRKCCKITGIHLLGVSLTNRNSYRAAGKEELRLLPIPSTEPTKPTEPYLTVP
ncbi:hypothetical protein AMTRI_Chr12g236540 [Amborella trichopoda]